MRIGLIGFGYWGAGFVARNLARVFDLAVIVDPEPERLVEAARQWGPWGAQVSSEPVVAFDVCDAVWIATPADTHYDLVKNALLSGVHVLCEKPFVMNSEEARELCELAEEQELALMVGHLSLFTNAHHSLKACLSHGHQLVTIKRYTIRPSLSDHSVLWGLGPHDVASVIESLGFPEEVSWEGNQHRMKGLLRYNRGDVVNISLDWLAAERERSIRVGGSPKDLAEVPNAQEPLLAEALAFYDLCKPERPGKGRDREWARGQALSVTECLDCVSLKVHEPSIQ